MAEKTVAGAGEQPVPAGREGTRAEERYGTPPVDIYETQEGLVLVADLPGVSREGLDIGVDNNVLTIQGRSGHIAPGDTVYREYDLIHFFRQFELSEAVDQARIAAELRHGVLTLQLPKAEKAKPRQIEVRVG
jgi:HSP20 family protein